MGKLALNLFRSITKNICQTKLLETSHSTASKQQPSATVPNHNCSQVSLINWQLYLLYVQ